MSSVIYFFEIQFILETNYLYKINIIFIKIKLILVLIIHAHMEKLLVIILPLFLVIMFLFWNLTSGYFKKEYGTKLWNQWGTRLFYWQGAIYTSSGVTILVLFILNRLNVLNF